jgi:hypothetical protein
MSYWKSKRGRDREIPGAVRVEYVAAFCDPDDPLIEEEVKYSAEMDSYILNVVPLWYSVKDFILSEVEPHLK